MRFIFFSFLYGLALSSSPLSERECPDQELGDECEAQCRLVFITCREHCTDSLCENDCLAFYSACVNSCPCSTDCPLGCKNCSHPLCFCKNPESNNPTYKQCIREASSAHKTCLDECSTEQECFDACYDTFNAHKDDCPCMSNCPNGCPCLDGYKCQPFIDVVCEYEHNRLSYIISADGHFKENRFIDIPESTYLDENTNEIEPFLSKSGHAILNGEVYIFGDAMDRKRISIIRDCKVVITSMKLIHNFENYAGATLTVPTSPNEVMLCFGRPGRIYCEDFDGSSSIDNPFTTNVPHPNGCLALANNLPLVVGGGNGGSYPYTASVEVLGISGWRVEKSHPLKILQMACLSVENGMITIGGQYISNDNERLHTNAVYLFQNNDWRFAGQLEKRTSYNSAINLGLFIVSVSGFSDPDGVNAVQIAHWNGTYVNDAKIITTHSGNCLKPILYESDPNACANSCDSFCFAANNI